MAEDSRAVAPVPHLPVAVLLPLGIVIGIAAAFSGTSGGLLIVPILLAAKFPAARAVGTAFLATFAISISSLAAHLGLAHVDPLLGVLLGIGGLIGGQLGARIVKKIPTRVFAVLFAGLLVALAVTMVADSAPNGPAHAAVESFDAPGWLLVALVPVGVAIGVIGSSAGLGGGFLFVPFLITVGVDHTLAVGTSFLATLVVSLSALVAHARQKSVDFRTGAALAVGGVVGSQIGAPLVDQVSGFAFSLIFAGVLLLLAARTAWGARKPEAKSAGQKNSAPAPNSPSPALSTPQEPEP